MFKVICRDYGGKDKSGEISFLWGSLIHRYRQNGQPIVAWVVEMIAGVLA